MNRLVSDVMTREVVVATPETPFRELVRLIEDHHLRALPVVDELQRVLGVVAESDLLIKEELQEKRLRTPLQRRGRARLAGTTAGEIMTSPAVTIDSSQTLSQAARVLRRQHIGLLPVVDDGRLIGIVTRSDLLTVFLRSDEDLLVSVQEAIVAVVDDTPSCTISATVHDGIVVLQGSVPFLSQVKAIGDSVRRIPGVVHLDLKATAASDDAHRWPDDLAL